MISVKKQGRFEVFSRGVEEPWLVYRDGVPYKQVWTWPEIDKILSGESTSPSAHATLPSEGTLPSEKIPFFKISTKVPAEMTASEINKELDKLNKQDSALGEIMIATGRGHERPSEYLKLADPLSVELRKNADRRQDLRIEIAFRYGPNPPSRLPTGRGFGPRSKTKTPTRGGIGLGKRLGGD